jgi:AmmeMemoRadiSam system protein A
LKNAFVKYYHADIPSLTGNAPNKPKFNFIIDILGISYEYVSTSTGVFDMITLDEKMQTDLLRLARAVIAEEFGIKPGDAIKFDDPVYNTKCGAFVTLHIKGSLRGCIGYIQGFKSIPETVRDMSRASAFRDPRFPSLRRDELDSIDIEISILSPIEEVKSIQDIVVGRDGLIITKGGRSGLLLPQVPVEQGWDLDTFLEYTCRKAGLPGSAWKQPGVKIERFSAQVFGEKDLGIIPRRD